MTIDQIKSIKCGSCGDKHATVADVKDCYAQAQHDEETAKAEQAAELAAERWHEERGGAVDDPRERELWAQEDLARETAAIQAREREEDVAAYTQKMERDEELAAAQRLDRMTGSHGRDMASDKQVKYVMDLLSDHEWPDVLDEGDVRNMERRQVSKLIDQLKRSPKRTKTFREMAELEAGLYKLMDGTIVRVYLGQKSGRMLAKQLVFVGTMGSSEEDIAKGLPPTWEQWSYVYLGLASKHVAGDYRKLSLEEAKEWGATTRSCCRCARRLDVPESVDAGIGPVCANKEEWA